MTSGVSKRLRKPMEPRLSGIGPISRTRYSLSNLRTGTRRRPSSGEDLLFSTFNTACRCIFGAVQQPFTKEDELIASGDLKRSFTGMLTGIFEPREIQTRSSNHTWIVTGPRELAIEWTEDYDSAMSSRGVECRQRVDQRFLGSLGDECCH